MKNSYCIQGNSKTGISFLFLPCHIRIACNMHLQDIYLVHFHVVKRYGKFALQNSLREFLNRALQWSICTNYKHHSILPSSLIVLYKRTNIKSTDLHGSNFFHIYMAHMDDTSKKKLHNILTFYYKWLDSRNWIDI